MSARSPAQRAGDEAVARVERHATGEWKVAARAAVLAVAAHRDAFTTDDVWALLERANMQPREPRALGPIMRRAVREGVCVATDIYRESTRVACHGRPLRVWRSLMRAT